MRYHTDIPYPPRHPSWWESFRRQLMAVFFPAYRPELHYMRGRGPKWHEKHARSVR